ncbi:MAG: hypothetical protein JSW43_02070 [Gemmatimonadota bacterium]|nr:MAG: hypothetical protein JSW43_02070 [Gemmatimonadota bacterium]
MFSRASYLVAAALPVLLACGARSPGDAPNPGSNTITRAELQDVDVPDLYTAIQRLRPRWLVVRGGMRSFNLESEIVVFQDQTYLGGTDILRTLGREGIFEIEYVDGPLAQASLPAISDRHVEAAIVIHMRAPPNR